MTRTCSAAAKKGLYIAIVSANRQIGQRFYRLSLNFKGAGTAAFSKVKPGQFAQIDLSDAALPLQENIPEDLVDVSQRKILLRRPFSFCNTIRKKSETIVEILYCVVGPASLRMTTLSKGDLISVIGPLGNGFSVPDGKKNALLVVGGMGAGPLMQLARHLTENHPKINITAFVGAKSKKELPFEQKLDEIPQESALSLSEFAEYGIKSLVTTDDGSAGLKGFVTDHFKEWLDQCVPAAEDTVIYSCGPEAMLAKVAEIAKEKKIDCQVCMERMMACGIGLCQSCAVECRVEGSNETIYKLCCEDGPVFNSKEIVFKL